MGSGIEVLVVGNCYFVKEDQDPALVKDYKDKFELDQSVFVLTEPACQPILHIIPQGDAPACRTGRKLVGMTACSNPSA